MIFYFQRIASLSEQIDTNIMENHAVLLHGPSDIRIEKWPFPQINDNEVLIKMTCVGICGSDVKLYTTGRCGPTVVTDPIVIGHEGAGVVEAVGAQVKNLKVGDRVAIEPTQPCRSCDYCKRGRYNLCVRPRYCASCGVHGNLATYYKHVADFCHLIPDNLSMEEGAAVQPLAIAIHACNRANIKLGSKVAIFGAGPIGVLCAMTAKAMGASKIVMTDVVQSRLDMAKNLVADGTLLVKGLSEDETAHLLTDMLGGPPDITIDACAHPVAQRVALTVTKSGGLVLVVGMSERKLQQVPLAGALLREVDVRGSLTLLNTYPAALAAVASGAIDLKRFITHHLPMERVLEALELARSGAAMKVIVHVQDRN